MDFKIKISCHSCKCNFELRSIETNVSEIICPNCSSKVPENISAHILKGLKELGAVPESFTTEESPLFPNDGFSFAVKSYSFPHLSD